MKLLSAYCRMRSVSRFFSFKQYRIRHNAVAEDLLGSRLYVGPLDLGLLSFALDRPLGFEPRSGFDKLLSLGAWKCLELL